MTVSKTEFEWREWFLGEGRYKGKGRRSKPRPSHFPYMIPMEWWIRLAAFLKRRKASEVKPLSRSVIDDFGTWVRNPRGGVEGVYEAMAYGVRWLALNMNEGDWTMPASWGTVILRARALGAKWFPWKRCYSLDDIISLLTVAKAWAQDGGANVVGLNIEKEIDLGIYTAREVVDLVNVSGFTGEAIIITEPWLYDNVEWSVFVEAGYKIVLEMFPRDAETAKDPAACIEHAHEKGVPNPYLCWDGRDAPRPARSRESVYTFDDAAGRWWPRG